MSTGSEPVFEARGLSKHFGHIEAVVDVSVAFRRGQITAIVGDNGAGKSTLVKMLTGALRPDEGEIVLNGETVVLHDPLDARKKGVEVVYQELALAPNLDVTANVFLGRELRRERACSGSTDWPESRWSRAPARSSRDSASTSPASPATSWDQCRAVNGNVWRWREPPTGRAALS